MCAAVMFPERALRYIGYLVLVLMPLLWSEKGFYQMISLIIFLVVAYGLHGHVWGRVPKKSFIRPFDAE